MYNNFTQDQNSPLASRQYCQYWSMLITFAIIDSILAFSIFIGQYWVIVNPILVSYWPAHTGGPGPSSGIILGRSYWRPNVIPILAQYYTMSILLVSEPGGRGATAAIGPPPNEKCYSVSRVRVKVDLKFQNFCHGAKRPRFLCFLKWKCVI